MGSRAGSTSRTVNVASGPRASAGAGQSCPVIRTATATGSGAAWEVESTTPWRCPGPMPKPWGLPASGRA